MEYLQKLGKSLVVPVAVLPIVAILKGIGYWLASLYPSVFSPIATFLLESGGVIIDNLPILFAISISMGMSKQRDPILAISAVISYLTITRMLNEETISLIFNTPINEVPIAFQNTENAFIGMISGIVAYQCYDRFSTMQLPQSLSFFSGKRAVPIICIVVMLIIVIIMMVVWPILYEILFAFGTYISKLGPLGAGIYAFFNRLLIPTGLHHAINAVFWFDVIGINDIGKFMGTVSGGVKGVTGVYQAGFFPMMMFGLPAAALAIYKNADEDKKKQIGAIMLAGAFASFLTGITEPLEFSFMFVAPVLYVIHAVMTGILVFIAATFHWIAGFSFSAGLIDFVLSVRSPFANHPYMLLVLGIGCAFVYYMVFDFCIRKFNLPTMGRERDKKEEVYGEMQTLLEQQEYDEIAIKMYDALGKRNNILHIDSCITRLRIEVKSIALIDEESLKEQGVRKIVKVGNNVQIMIGTEVQFIVEAMHEILE